jgi:threonine dehydrogenase-like Zn-dependent dehydrogenase
MIVSPFSKCYKVQNLTMEESVLIEPAACAVHGMDKLQMPFGARVLLIGAGPTGLILAQLMKVSGSSSSANQTSFPWAPPLCCHPPGHLTNPPRTA